MLSSNRKLLKASLLAALSLPSFSLSAEQTVVLDTVVASVDGVPITLSELSKRLGRRVSLSEVSRDADARTTLDAIVFDHLLSAEAEKKRVSVSEADIEDYIDEVAKRNSLSKEGFIQALQAEQSVKGKTEALVEYRAQVKRDILKSRLASSQIKSSVAISDEEVDKYVKDHSQEFAQGARLKLRQIFLDVTKHSEAEAKSSLKAIRNRHEDGDDFDDLAEELSEGAEAKEGGLIGEMAEKDLSPEIFDAVLSLKEGEVSRIVTTSKGYHLFQVEERIKGDKQKIKDDQREEIRKRLERQVMDTKLANFFSEGIFKEHAIDKKI